MVINRPISSQSVAFNVWRGRRQSDQFGPNRSVFVQLRQPYIYRKLYILIVFIFLSQEDIMSYYRKLYILLVVPRRLRARKRRYYVIQIIINSNSFMVLSQGACARASVYIMSYRKFYILIVFIVLSQGACARKRRYYVLQKSIYSNSCPKALARAQAQILCHTEKYIFY